MSNIRLVPKVVLLMVFSTLLLLAKLWFDASNLEVQSPAQRGHRCHHGQRHRRSPALDRRMETALMGSSSWYCC